MLSWESGNSSDTLSGRSQVRFTCQPRHVHLLSHVTCDESMGTPPSLLHLHLRPHRHVPPDGQRISFCFWRYLQSASTPITCHCMPYKAVAQRGILMRFSISAHAYLSRPCLVAGFGSAIVIVAVWTVCQTCGLDAGEALFHLKRDYSVMSRRRAVQSTQLHQP